MRRKRNRSKMKEQEKSSQRELNAMKASKRSNMEFKIMVIRMLKEFSEDLQKLSETSTA